MYILHGILGKHVDYRVCRGDTWFHDRKKIIEDCIQLKTINNDDLYSFPDYGIAVSRTDFGVVIFGKDMGKANRNLEANRIGSLQYAVLIPDQTKHHDLAKFKLQYPNEPPRCC